MEIGEFDFIERLRNAFPAVSGETLGIGDDCAVIRMPSAAHLDASGTGLTPGSELLVSTDLLLEGVHFLRDSISPWQLGWKAAAVNFSDIAAMGGRPRWTFLSIAIPQEGTDSRAETPVNAAWADAFIAGYKAISDRYGVQLLGGDTTASLRDLCINVAVMGECPAGQAVRRSAALPGDLVCVSGTLGDSAAGLKAIQEGLDQGAGDSAVSTLIRRHCEPQPRVGLGQTLATLPGIGAMMDLSDGLASDLRHILKASAAELTGGGASSLGARIDLELLPLSEELSEACSEYGWDPLSLALEGGEDYELLFTCRPDSFLPSSFSDPVSGSEIPLTVIGSVTAEPSLIWLGANRDFQGFTHF